MYLINETRDGSSKHNLLLMSLIVNYHIKKGYTYGTIVFLYMIIHKHNLYNNINTFEVYQNEIKVVYSLFHSSSHKMDRFLLLQNSGTLVLIG